jgi:hypothetical protein
MRSVAGDGMSIIRSTGGTGSGTANFTFSLSGTFTASNVANGGGESVSYSLGLPVQGTTGASGNYTNGIFDGTLPPPTVTVPFTFTYGVPFEVAASLDGTANPGRSSVGSSGHIHLTLQSLGFTVAGGNYTSTSATGTGTGVSLGSNVSYAGVNLTNNLGFHSTASLLGGTTGGSRDVALNFITAAGSTPLVSDVLDLQGIGGDQYVLQLQYDEAAAIAQFGSEANVMLGWFDPALGAWQNAVDGNTGGSSTKILGAYNAGANYDLGTWGVDTANNTVWAVVNHNSEFAVTAAEATPEPGDWTLLELGALVLGCCRRRPGKNQKA